MAAERTETTDMELLQDQVGNIPKRHARVTVKYNRKELQRRLDVEKWIDENLDRLYTGQVGGCAREQEALRETALAARFLILQ